MVPGSEPARRVIDAAIRARVFPGATVDVGNSAGALWQEAFGSLTFARDDAGARPASLETPYDLASLTKPIATGSLCMALLARNALSLETRVADCIPEWSGSDRRSVTIADLLEHASGLPARLVDQPPGGRREFEHDICALPLEYEPRTRALYSDIGFILLGFVAADRGAGPIASQFAGIMRDVAPGLTFTLPTAARPLAAPTRALDEDVRRGQTLAGVVHDNYAAALGGAAGHAGLFGTAFDVGSFARVMLRAARGEGDQPSPFTPDFVRRFTRRGTVPGSSRALAWDTMLTTSSCGTKMSASAFGHVGFTGTSLWIDPDRDRYFVLLTNRAMDGGSLEQMRDVRRAFHDAAGS